MSIKEIRALTGLSQKAFADAYNIPVRSIENWESGTRSCPDYVLELLEFKVKYDTDKKGDKIMKIWKVYGNNVRRATGHAIVEIDEKIAHNLICEHLDSMAELIKFPEDAEDDVINDIYEKFYEAGINDFEKQGYYGCGDFDIIVSDEMPERPNKAGDDMPEGFN